MSPWSPVGFNLERALWRDSAALLQSSDSHQIPANLRWLRELQRMAFLDRDRVFTISAFGLSSEKAKVFLWRAEELPLPLAYLREPRLVDALTAGLAAAEQAARALRFGVRILVGETLGPGGTADKDRVTGLVDSLAPLRAFWPALDLHFRTFMLQLAREFDADDGTSALRAWSAELRMAAAAAFQRACAALETESRGYRAAAEAAPRFFAQLGEALQIKAREEVPA